MSRISTAYTDQSVQRHKIAPKLGLKAVASAPRSKAFMQAPHQSACWHPLFNNLSPPAAARGDRVIVKVILWMMNRRSVAIADQNIGTGSLFEHEGEILATHDKRCRGAVARDGLCNLGCKIRLAFAVHHNRIAADVLNLGCGAKSGCCALNDLGQTAFGQVAIRSAYCSRLVISSAREFVADAEAARITKHPAGLASALFRVEGKHRIHAGAHESDAMMIAGDSEGASATRHEIAARVDALARTTGSMVFNAPGAHEKAKSERFRRQAAGGESDAAPSILERIGGVGGENIFGFTKLGLGLFLAALTFSLVVQAKDILNPSAMIARMDVRPFGYALGLGDIACMVEGKHWTCRDDIVYDWSQYEDQTGTYLGYMAKGRAERQARNDERVAQLTKEHNVQSQPYTGLSGLMRDYTLDTASNGEYLYAENGYTRLWPAPPVKARIEETRRVGCFTEKLFYGDNAEAEFKRDGDIGVRDLGTYIDEVIKASQIALIDGDEGLETYFQTRLSNTRVAFDLFGMEGLQEMQRALAAPTHDQAVTLLAKRVDDPGFMSGKSELRQAELKALVKRPERFIPCLALRYSGR